MNRFVSGATSLVQHMPGSRGANIKGTVNELSALIRRGVNLRFPVVLPRGSIIVCVFEVSVARRFWFSAP